MGDDDDDDGKVVDNNVVIIDDCDESKCVSSLRVPVLTTDNGASLFQFICYAEGNAMSPFACSEGYEGHVVEHEPSIPSPLYSKDNGGGDGVFFSYYTCCPPKPNNNNHSNINSTSSSSQHHERYCGNPILFEENTSLLDNENICNGKGEPRNTTKTFGHTESYVCCNSSLPVNNVVQEVADDDANSYSKSNSGETTNDNFNFLDERDCVPYFCNDQDYDCLSINHYGGLEIMQCYDDVYNDTFIYPRPVAKSKHVVRFECCKIGTHTQLLPMETTSFKLTLWIQLVVSSIALISSLILMISLILPLLLKKSKRYNNNTGGAASRPTTSRPQRTPRQTTQQRIHRKYSSYNLYLVFLAFPDILFNVFMVWRCISDLSGHAFDAEWALVPWIYGETRIPYITYIFYGCTTANLGVNTLIAFEVFKLLENSSQRVRHSPPTIKRVVLQATGVYLYSIVLSVIVFGVMVSIPKFIRSDTKRNQYYHLISSFGGPVVLAISAGIPFMVLIYLCGVAWRRRLVRKSDRHLRTLAIFFLRIVFVFIVIWAPAYILWGIDLFKDSAVAYGPLFAVSMLLISIQAILSNTLAIMKPDVKKAVLDLITFSVCCNSNNNSNSNSNSNSNRTNRLSVITNTRQSITTMERKRHNKVDKVDKDNNEPLSPRSSSSSSSSSLLSDGITTTTTAAAAEGTRSTSRQETTSDSQQQKVFGTSDDEADDRSIQSCMKEIEEPKQHEQRGEDIIIAV